VRASFVLALTAMLAMLLQTTVFPALPWLPDAFAPDLILVLAVYLGLRHRTASGALGAFLLGYFLDTFSGTVPGTNACALTVVFTMTYLLARNLWVEGGVTVVVVVLLAGCVREGVLLLTEVLSRALTSGHPAWHHVLLAGLPQTLAAALAAPAIFALVRWQRRQLGLVA